MKKRQTRLLVSAMIAAFISAGLFMPGLIRAGNLEPPGSPDSTMKTLDEIEPRIPISRSDLPKAIYTPGSYYLAENITSAPGGISIFVDGVSLDLSGFTLAGGTGNGIYIEGNNVSVTNGTVSGWSVSGVNGMEAYNSQFTNLRLYRNGGDGLSAGNSSIIKDCVARDNTFSGIAGENGVVVSNCTAYSNSEDGIKTADDAIVKGCTSRFNTGDGIKISQRCLVENNILTSNGGGIHAAGSAAINGDNRIKSNLICNNTTGLLIDTPANYIAANIVKGSADNYSIVADNQLNILLSEIPETIDWAAMVTLTGSLTSTSTEQHGITVNADDVTIDLGGHSLKGTGTGTNNGIDMNGCSNVEIRNGTVRDFYNGVYAILGYDNRFVNVRSVSNGLSGFYLTGASHLIKDCTASYNGTSAASKVYGIRASSCSTVTGNTVSYNGESATNTVIGISASAACIVTNNSVYNNGINAVSAVVGIGASEGSTLTNNTASYNGSGAGDVCGFQAGRGSTVINNAAYTNGTNATGTVYGIRLFGNNVVDQNTAYMNNGTNMNDPGFCTFGINRAP